MVDSDTHAHSLGRTNSPPLRSEQGPESKVYGHSAILATRSKESEKPEESWFGLAGRCGTRPARLLSLTRTHQGLSCSTFPLLFPPPNTSLALKVADRLGSVS